MTWIGNTAATMDMTPHAVGMVGIRKPTEMVSVVMGNKQVKKSVAIRDIPGVVCDNQGNQKLPVKVSNSTLVPDTVQHIQVIETRLDSWGKSEALVLISPDRKHQIKFDIKILMLNGMSFAMYMKHTQEEVVNIAATNNNLMKQVMLSIQQRLGHINERTTKEIAKSLGWKLNGNQTLNCVACAAGKAKQKLLKLVFLTQMMK